MIDFWRILVLVPVDTQDLMPNLVMNRCLIQNHVFSHICIFPVAMKLNMFVSVAAVFVCVSPDKWSIPAWLWSCERSSVIQPTDAVITFDLIQSWWKVFNNPVFCVCIVFLSFTHLIPAVSDIYSWFLLWCVCLLGSNTKNGPKINTETYKVCLKNVVLAPL